MPPKKPEPKDSETDKDDETQISPIESIDRLVLERTPSLLVISGPNIGRAFPLSHDEIVIGRVDSCDLKVEDDLVSRHHCKLTTTPEGVHLVDLSSTNGTLLNGRKVDKALLKENDQIQVGAVTIFKFHYQEEVEAKFLGQLYQAATKDFLTNTYNKKFFMDRLQSEFSYAQRHEGNLSILVLDIDHFKKVNDTYGHLAGDIAIQKMAHHLMTHTRKDDVVARFGGEEFVILMRDCDQEQARSLAENLREGISRIAIQVNSKNFKITVSVGVATLSEVTKTKILRFESLLQEADNQLYKAKANGRNQVCI